MNHSQIKSNNQSFTKPSKDDQQVAQSAHASLVTAINHLTTDHPEIEVADTSERIQVPRSALRLLADILQHIGEGKAVSVFPQAAELTTQAAADYLNCSRPHLVKLLETGEIPFTKIGKHRRVRFEHVTGYKREMKARQKEVLIEMMGDDESAKLYNTL